MMKILIFLFITLLFIDPAQAANSLDVIINEVAWMGTTASYNDEWIELYNKSGQSVNLEDWVLKAADGSPEIQLSRTVLDSGFYLLERTDDNTVAGITADQIYTGALSNNGEVLELYDNFGNLIDKVDAPSGWPAGDNTKKQTMERSLAAPGAAKWQTSLSPGGTPKSENSKVADIGSPPVSSEDRPPILPENILGKPIVYPTGIIINEILPSPAGPDEEEEWAEIFNENNFEVNISGWQVVDTAGTIKTYTFPEGSIINSGEFLVLFRPITKITLNNRGDGLKLLQPDGNVINEISYDNAPRGESYSRFKSSWAWTSTPTPGNANTLPAPTSAPEKKITEDGPPRTELAAIGEQAPKNSNTVLLFLAAIFTSFAGGGIILILKHVRT